MVGQVVHGEAPKAGGFGINCELNGAAELICCVIVGLPYFCNLSSKCVRCEPHSFMTGSAGPGPSPRL